MKYAKGKTLPTIESVEGTTSKFPANLDSTRPIFLAHISKVIGRKQLAYELRISKHLLDMWLSGERTDPIERTRVVMRIAAKTYGPDLPLDIAQYLVEEFGGLVVERRKVKS